MKSAPSKLIALILLCIFSFSCSKQDNGIYFNEIEENLNPDDLIYSNLETEILDLVNEYRKNLSLPALENLSIVSAVADNHTNYMVETGKISHDNFDNRSQYLINNTNAKSVGENVAFGYSSAEGVFNGWLKSEGHKNVIENPNYTHFGISVELNAEGRNYFTQIFIKK